MSFVLFWWIFFLSKRIFVFKEQNLLLNFKSLCHRLAPLLWYYCWLRVLQPSGPLLLDVSSWFSARCFYRSHFLFSPYYAKLCTKLWVIHAPLMHSLQWLAIWSSIKIGQIKKAFYQVWFSSRDAECLLSVFMDTAGTWYLWGEGWEFEAIQVDNDGELLSSVIFNGELSTGNLCCSFMCWVAVQVCQQTFHIWIFCCWTWLPTHCAHHRSAALPTACPAITCVGVSPQLNESQNKSLSQFR